jgi:hypothetical protein
MTDIINRDTVLQYIVRKLQEQLNAHLLEQKYSSGSIESLDVTYSDYSENNRLICTYSIDETLENPNERRSNYIKFECSIKKEFTLPVMDSLMLSELDAFQFVGYPSRLYFKADFDAGGV